MFYSSALENVPNRNTLSGGDGDFWYHTNRRYIIYLAFLLHE